MASAMTSADRLSAALSHREADRVPFVLPAILHGARELGLSLREYFSRAEHIVEGQVRLRDKLGHDAVFGFMYASQEFEAFGGCTLFRDDGPPNAGAPVIRSSAELDRLVVPRIADCPSLMRVLRVIELLKARVGAEVPVLGSIISPFSLPVMQMGFEAYLVLLYEDPDRFRRLMEVNEQFAVTWANAQLEAGASALVYADPVSSPAIIPRELFARTGHPIACRTLARIHGSCALGFASAPVLPIVDDLMSTGAVGISASALEDLSELKRRCRGRLAVMGNLNAIEMRRWTPQQAEDSVKAALAAAGPGGGFVLTDNHGEIPWQVSDDTLVAIADAVRRWGRYPLDWVARDER